jgi:hypothetical protein
MVSCPPPGPLNEYANLPTTKTGGLHLAAASRREIL